MTIEPYNYNDEPSGRSETLVQALEKIEHLEKQLKIAVEALKCYKQENWTYADTYEYYRLDLYEGGWIHAERALHEIKELEK